MTSLLSHAEVLGYALAAGWTRPNANMITVIANYESGDDPKNIGDQTLSRYGSIGLTQDFTGAHTPDEILGHGGNTTASWTPELVAELENPLTNMKAALIIFKEQGFRAWSTFNDLRGTVGWQALLASVEKMSPVMPGPVAPGAPVPKPNPGAPKPKPAAGRNDLALLGNADQLSGVALAYAELQSVKPTENWKGLCLRFVRMALHVNAGAPTAAAAWYAVPNAEQHTWYNPPAGTPVFWTGGSQGFGHVALADGKGNVWSTDFGPTGYLGDGKVHLVPIASLSQHDTALRYAGWSERLNGVSVYLKPAA